MVLRAGDSSLHGSWLDCPNRNWDLCVSYFGSEVDPYSGQYDFLHKYVGPKWLGISDFINNYKKVVFDYEQVWFPDDDILTNGYNINKFFEANKSAGFDVSQPALTLNSFVTYPITLRNPLCNWRQTNFVEIMLPCFSKRAVKQLSSTFNVNQSGWGLEWVWQNICAKKGWNIGIIDIAPVTHTRKVGSAGHGGSNSPVNDKNCLLSKLNSIDPTPKIITYKYRINLPSILLSMQLLNKVNKILIKMRFGKNIIP